MSSFEEEYGYQWERDPRCPGCKAVHPRKQFGSMSFRIKDDECREKGNLKNSKGEPFHCKYTGPITKEDFLKGLPRKEN
jgi:hypothetical protein